MLNKVPVRMVWSLTERIDEVIRHRNCQRRRRARQCIEEADNDGGMMRMSSQRDDDDEEIYDPILFSNLRNNHRPTRFPTTPVEGTKTDSDNDNAIIDMSYGECIDIIANHERWLNDAIHHHLPNENDVVNENRHNEKNTIIDDIIVGYLSDNSPELLLSVLACIKLTLTINNTPIRPGKRKMKLLPAMIHCRWTPTEIKQALQPSSSSLNKERYNTTNRNVRQVTIILYGSGYKHVATEAVRLINQSPRCCCHWSVAMPIPKLTATRRYSCFNDHDKGCVEIESKMKIDDTKKSRRDNHLMPEFLADAGVSDADALLLFTSGTTNGGGKGVRLSHRSLFVQSHAKTLSPCSYNTNTRMVATTVPWFHVGGMSSAIAVMLAGGTLIFPLSVISSVEDGGGRFRPEVIMKTLLPPPSSSSTSSLESSTMVANTLVVVPAMLHSMVGSAAHSSFPYVRLILVGGQSIVGYGGDGWYDQMRRMFPNARVVQTYACTEAGSSITFEDLTAEVGFNNCTVNSACNCRLEKIRALPQSDDHSVFTGPGTSVGYSPPHVQIGIFHIEKVAEAAKAHGPYSLMHLPPQLLLLHGIIGVIGTRGPHVMSGYWNRSIINESGDNNITVDDDHDGWVLTNDLGRIDPVSKKLYFCGRADDVIRTGGESVLAIDVERVIVDFKEDDYIIVECSVFPLPDERFGETVCAALVLSTSAEVGVNNEATPTVEEDKLLTKRIRQYCTTRQLASFKQPRRVFSVLKGVLPRNSSGKVLKHAVIKMCASNSKEISRL